MIYYVKIIKMEELMDPFLKWAGGKRWLVEKKLCPIPENYNSFCEPFVGSGAMLFHLVPNSAIINDINSDLIETYQALADDWEAIFQVLVDYDKKHSKEFYYKIRDYSPRKPHLKAARFIYLNRTCWNGLYRVNLNGKFNVPKGTKEKVVLTTDNFQAVAELLKKCAIRNEDFQTVIDETQDGDFLFVDPPYTIKHNNNGFVKYNEKMFSWEDQVRLSDTIKSAAKRGVQFVVTNAKHSCIEELYKGFVQIPLRRASVIAASSQNRGIYEELLITNIDNYQKG